MRNFSVYDPSFVNEEDRVEMREAGKSLYADSDTFKLLFYFRAVDYGHSVLLKVGQTLM